jgi:hypothetical protein
MLTKAQTESLVKHIREIANILEKSVGQTTTAEQTTKRGRKPGAVSDDIRCTATLPNEERCKNRATQGSTCGKHANA